MTIQVNPEQEQVIGRAIQAGLTANADDIVDVGVDTIRQHLQARVDARTELNTEQWLEEFSAWMHSHSTATPLLSDEAVSRNLIYGVRGL
jgi:hypothetical protein